MKKKIIVLILLLLAVLFGFSASWGQESESEGEFKWLSDLSGAENLARKEGRPMLIVFR